MEGNSSDMFVVEEIDSNDLPESELAEFQEAKPLLVLGFVNEEDDPNNKEQERELIQKFVRGEGELPSIYTKLEPEDETEGSGDDDEAQQWRFPERETDEFGSSDDEVPTSTSALAKKTKLAKSTKRRRRKKTFNDDDSAPRYTRKRSVLNVALQGLMGEANLSYARGQIEMAEKICLEIIRQNPLASEPFMTLAEIYETRDKEKHLNFLTIAAHLNPHDRDQWIRIAEMHIANGNYVNARIFYSKAIRVIRKDYDLRLRKALVLEHLKDTPGAMWTYLKMIPFVPTEKSVLCLETAKKVAAYYHEHKKLDLALEAMDGAYNVCADIFSVADLNLYLELLILNKQYLKLITVLQERTNFELETLEHSKPGEIMCVKIPEDFLPDFRTKLCVCLIKLQLDYLLHYIIRNIQDHIPRIESYLNLYVDIAEALMQEHKYAEAIELLRPIIESEEQDGCPAFIWLRHAECLRQLNRYDEAIESYQSCINSAPYCYDAKLTLASLLKQQGRLEEAVKALDQAEDSEGQQLHARLLYERCRMLQEMNKTDEFLEAGCTFLGRKSVKLRNREELLTFSSGSNIYHLDGLKNILQMRNVNHGNMAPDSYEFNIKLQTDITDLSLEDEYKLFLDILQVAFKHRKFSFLERLSFHMVTTKRFIDFHHELERIVILACYYNDDCLIAFSYLREMIGKQKENNSLWNLLSLFLQKGQDVRYYRYLRRFFTRNPHLKFIPIYLGHYALNCCSYKLALKIYTQLFKEQPTALLALCIAVAFNQVSMQKRIISSAVSIGQAIAFTDKYATLRRLECEDTETQLSTCKQNLVEQEICYNIGRIYHQSGLLHLAVEYYERALRVENSFIASNEKYFGLKQETAYNLHLIYRANGNLRKARQILYEFCVV